MRVRRIAGWLAFAVILAQAQHSTPAFDVSSIHPHAPDDTRFRVKPPSNGQFTAVGAVAKLIVMLAYDVQESQVADGPDWFDKEKWDIEARSAGHTTSTSAETRAMLQNLLAERFAMKVHRETRQLPAYALTIAKGGPKFKPAAPGTSANIQITGNSIRLDSGDMSRLSQLLATSVGRPVIDRTGLNQTYDLSLTWDDAPINEGGVPVLDAPAATGDNGSIFTAIRNQLGLRLESRRAPVGVIVIDRIERPSAN